MSRYARMFDRLGGDGALGAFLMLGDPTPEASLALIDAAVAGGADMLELGIPFSDPVADGPVIQAAAMRALEQGVRTGDCIRLLNEVRRRNPTVPIGILTYANIVMARGVEAFCRAAADSGVDSLLIADVPSLEIAPFAHEMQAQNIDPVLIAATNTPPATLERIARIGRGYTYCLARAGVTGSGSAPTLDHGPLFAELARLGAAPPVLGFGISTPTHVAAALDAGAAGAISGSAIVEQARHGPAAVEALVRSLKAATRR